MKNSSFLNAKRYALHATGGFALLELLTAVAIFGIITSVVLVTYSKVSEQLFVSTLAYEVALSFRQAQSYGVSVKQFKGGGTSTFDAGYGIHFSKTDPSHYVLFADGKAEGNQLYEYDGEDTSSGCTSGTECVSVFKIERKNFVKKFCAIRSDTGAEECTSGTAVGIDFLNVLFVRPNPDAIIVTDKSNESGKYNLARYRTARVVISSPSGMERSIEVWNTGQISVK